MKGMLKWTERRVTHGQTQAFSYPKRARSSELPHARSDGGPLIRFVKAAAHVAQADGCFPLSLQSVRFKTVALLRLFGLGLAQNAGP